MAGDRSSVRSLWRDSDPPEITEVRARYRALGVPRVVATPQGLRSLPLDPRVAYLVSRIDGQSTVETLVDVTGFALDEVLSVLARLVQLGAVELDPGL